MTLMSGEIAEKGIVVLEKIDRMPVYGEPYVSPFYVIAINHRGRVEVEYDGLAMTFNPHDISVVYPHHELFCKKASLLYKATLVVVSEKLFGQLVGINAAKGRFWHESYPHFHLSQNQYNDVMTIVKSLRTVLHIGSPAIGDSAAGLLQILTNIIDIFRSENENKSVEQNSNLSPRYYEAIKAHCRQHHDVGFYADLFCLSPKYFSTLIRKETGHTAGHWIRQHLATQAKIMLRTDTNVRLNEVAETLGFPDLATFSRFFRHEIGMTPSEYRQWQRVK